MTYYVIKDGRTLCDFQDRAQAEMVANSVGGDVAEEAFVTSYELMEHELAHRHEQTLQEREKLSEEYLLSHGYFFDEKETNDLMAWWKSDPAYVHGIDLKCYKDKSRRIDIKREWTNRYGQEGYNVHIDNEDYESVAWGEFLYVDDFETFIKITFDKGRYDDEFETS